MSFDDIVANDTAQDIKKDAMMAQALRRQEYNRQYQQRLRNVTRLLTLEKRVDADIQHVIGYIKRKYAKEYADYVEPVAPATLTNPRFDDWVVLSAKQYKSKKEAFELSRLGEHMAFGEFSKFFDQYFNKSAKGFLKK